MKLKTLLNPYANRWGAKRRIEEVKAALLAAGIEVDLTIIPEPKAGTKLAMEAVEQGYDGVIGAGGDGTLNEVVNGLIRMSGDAPTIPFGVVPIGTGNDFNDMAGLPRDLNACAKIIAAGNTRQVDAGRVNNHYFQNNCALAMEPLVSIENNKITRLAGNPRYLVALFRALIKLRAWQMTINWDAGSYSGSAILLSVCNSPRTGGLFPMAPQAKLDDGLFDFVHVPDVPKLTVLAILARLFRGAHIYHPKTTYARAARIEIESDPPTPIHADGEVISEGTQHIVYEVLPGKITLLSSA